jgi:hypothetical protein
VNEGDNVSSPNEEDVDHANVNSPNAEAVDDYDDDDDDDDDDDGGEYNDAKTHDTVAGSHRTIDSSEDEGTDDDDDDDPDEEVESLSISPAKSDTPASPVKTSASGGEYDAIEIHSSEDEGTDDEDDSDGECNMTAATDNSQVNSEPKEVNEGDNVSSPNEEDVDHANVNVNVNVDSPNAEAVDDYDDDDDDDDDDGGEYKDAKTDDTVEGTDDDDDDYPDEEVVDDNDDDNQSSGDSKRPVAVLMPYLKRIKDRKEDHRVQLLDEVKECTTQIKAVQKKLEKLYDVLLGQACDAATRNAESL